MCLKDSVLRKGARPMSDKELTTLFTGRHCEVLDEVGSTNTYLSDLLRTVTLPEGSVIRAISQNAGRGQYGSAWHSAPGENLLLSFVFYPSGIAPKEVFVLNKSYALGIFDFIASVLGKQAFIKWPNDILAGGRKVAGLLVENSIQAGTIVHSILGAGINVNQREFPALPDATSLSLLSGKRYNPDELFNILCGFLEKRYLQVKNRQWQQLDADYLKALYRRNEWHMFEAAGNSFEGFIEGVDENGRLMVRNRQDRLHLFGVKEISFL